MASQKYLDDLKEDVAMLARLTDELLQFAKAEAPGPVELQPTNVAEAVQTAVRREFAYAAAVHVDVDPGLEAECNLENLVRSLANVLRNAVRYAGDDGPITVAAHQKGRHIEIRIADQGPGVPPDALEKIFTPFYRVDDARDRRTGGTGLGLAIVRTCIEACGGTVECSNREPSGLEVLIRLPAASTLR
jgi:two-component system sensor histidine kinase CpxA